MSLESIAPEALQLSDAERAQLASTLWASLENPYDKQTMSSEAEAIELAAQRDAEIESGKVRAITHTEMMNRLRA